MNRVHYEYWCGVMWIGVVGMIPCCQVNNLLEIMLLCYSFIALPLPSKTFNDKLVAMSEFS